MLTVLLLADNNVRSLGEQVATTALVAFVLAILFCVLALAKLISRLTSRPGVEITSRVSGLVLASIAVRLELWLGLEDGSAPPTSRLRPRKRPAYPLP